MKKLLDLKLFGLVVILTVALVFIGVDFIEGQKKDKPDPGKPDKPFQPGNPGKERIAFYGDLQGDDVLEGCCPNAGPFPAYTMTLNFGSDGSEGYPSQFGPGTYDGWLFINRWGAGRNQKYKVQFWWDYDNDLGIEIIGGDMYYDKKTKVLTVIFTDEDCKHIKSDTFIKEVNFTLVRHESD
jgi:hypothetical protein